MAREKIIYGTPVRLKSESKLMRSVGWLVKPFNADFMTSYWTTLFTIVYAPSSFDIEDETHYYEKQGVLEHEGIHIKDFKKYHIIFLLTYLLPYFRFVWERRAYLPELEELLDKHAYSAFYQRVERISSILGGSEYFWCWPKSWIKKWFLKKTGMVEDIDGLYE